MRDSEIINEIKHSLQDIDYSTCISILSAVLIHVGKHKLPKQTFLNVSINSYQQYDTREYVPD
jgi:hypothetical protein